MINKKNLIVIGILLISGIAMGILLSYLFFHAPELNLKGIWVYIFGSLLFLPGIAVGFYCVQNTWGCATYIQYFAPVVYGLLLPLIYILGLLAHKEYKKYVGGK